MVFWDKIFSRSKSKCVTTGSGTSTHSANSNETLAGRIERLWNSALKLGWSNDELQKAISIYTELLTLVDKNSTTFNVCGLFRNRAMAYRGLENFDAALKDLAQELEIATKRNNRLRVWDCKEIIEETRRLKRNAEIQQTGGNIAEKFQLMEQQADKFWGYGPDADAAFESLFAELQNNNPEIRAEASRLLSDKTTAISKLISIYEQCMNTDFNKACLAGRVLGRNIDKGRYEMIPAQTVQLSYGIDASFISCTCIYCGHLNNGIAAPPNGPMVGYYHQKNNEGAYAIPVLCDKCSKEFFVVWDMDPR